MMPLSSPITHGQHVAAACGPPPCAVTSPGARGRPGNAALGMGLFVATETMVFAGLISGLLILRAGSSEWPPADQPRLPIAMTAFNTVILLSSAFTMARAGSARARDVPATTRWLAATAGLGAAFLVLQGIEWLRLLGYGLRASSSLYAATFYTIIGCHAAHVLAAVLALALLVGRAVRAQRSRRSLPTLDGYPLYWFFVVGIWPILYVLVYLT